MSIYIGSRDKICAVVWLLANKCMYVGDPFTRHPIPVTKPITKTNE